MISMMREYARSLKIVLLIVVVVFILTSGVLFYFGSGPFSSGKSNAVAVVNGEEIPPERFIPIAEDVGLMHELSERLLRAACRAAMHWPWRRRVRPDGAAGAFAESDVAAGPAHRRAIAQGAAGTTSSAATGLVTLNRGTTKPRHVMRIRPTSS